MPAELAAGADTDAALASERGALPLPRDLRLFARSWRRDSRRGGRRASRAGRRRRPAGVAGPAFSVSPSSPVSPSLSSLPSTVSPSAASFSSRYSTSKMPRTGRRYPPDRSWSASSNTTCRMNGRSSRSFGGARRPRRSGRDRRRRARGRHHHVRRVAIRERRIGSQTGGFQQRLSAFVHQRVADLCHLRHQRSVGRQNQRARPSSRRRAVPVAQQVGEDGHEVAQGLARAGLGGDHHVLPRAEHGRGLRLHVRRGLEPEAAQRREHRGVRVLEARERNRLGLGRVGGGAERGDARGCGRREGAARLESAPGERDRRPHARRDPRRRTRGWREPRREVLGRAPRRRGSLRASRPSRRSLARRRRRVRDARTRREARGETKSAARPARSRASRRSPSTSKGARAGRGVVVRGAPLAFARGRGATSRRRVGNPKRPTVYGFHACHLCPRPGVCRSHPGVVGLAATQDHTRARTRLRALRVRGEARERARRASHPLSRREGAWVSPSDFPPFGLLPGVRSRPLARWRPCPGSRRGFLTRAALSRRRREAAATSRVLSGRCCTWRSARP